MKTNKMKENPKLLPPLIPKEMLLEIEKTFRRIWDKEQKTEHLFKKAVSLHEQTQALILQELSKPENERDQNLIAMLYQRLSVAEETIDDVASLTKELQKLREYFYGFMSEPHEAEKK